MVFESRLELDEFEVVDSVLGRFFCVAEGGGWTTTALAGVDLATAVLTSVVVFSLLPEILVFAFVVFCGFSLLSFAVVTAAVCFSEAIFVVLLAVSASLEVLGVETEADGAPVMEEEDLLFSSCCLLGFFLLFSLGTADFLARF